MRRCSVVFSAFQQAGAVWAMRLRGDEAARWAGGGDGFGVRSDARRGGAVFLKTAASSATTPPSALPRKSATAPVYWWGRRGGRAGRPQGAIPVKMNSFR